MCNEKKYNMNINFELVETLTMYLNFIDYSYCAE